MIYDLKKMREKWITCVLKKELKILINENLLRADNGLIFSYLIEIFIVKQCVEGLNDF